MTNQSNNKCPICQFEGGNHSFQCKDYKELSWELSDFLPELESNPMGASEWKNHGIKYGYWSYFMNQKAFAGRAEDGQSMQDPQEAHDTADGYCCACDYDIACMNEAIAQERKRVLEEVEQGLKNIAMYHLRTMEGKMIPCYSVKDVLDLLDSLKERLK